MSKFKQALGINPDIVRIRELEMNGQKMRVRVPLSHEAEEIYKRTQEPSAELVEQKFKEIAQPLLDKKDELTGEEIQFTDNDVIVKEQSMRDLAKSKATTELRILETFKLLVPIDGTNLEGLTYEDISAEFPLPVQLAMVKKITEIISPSYEENRKN